MMKLTGNKPNLLSNYGPAGYNSSLISKHGAAGHKTKPLSNYGTGKYKKNSLSSHKFTGYKSNLLPSHRFTVTFGKNEINFSKISNIEASIEYETILEGGNNDYPHILKKPKSQQDKLILEKGVVKKGDTSLMNSLVQGCNLENIIIMVKGIDGKTIEQKFSFDYGTIISRKFSDLNALGTDLLIETLELTHTGLIVI